MKLFASLLAGVLTTAAVFAAELRPNFVVIFIDDLGYGDIGPYGATKQRTPNLDRMAKEGLKLTSFYAAPVCSVSRAQMMTGCYGARVSVPGVYGPGSKNGLNPNELTMAERLKELGYATMCIGKWHLGDHPDFLPTKQGFDHYLGIPYSNDMQRKSLQKNASVVPLVRDDKVEELLTDEAQSKIVERYTDEAVKFIRTSKDKPFLLYMPHTAVHTPIHPGAAFAGKSQNGRFGDWVEEVDWSVGRVLDTLRELKLDQNTLVVFTSDNGPWLVKGADGGTAGPLRGGKGSTWEGGVREPTIAWWPGKIAPGTACDAVAGTIDLTPTFVSLAGGKIAPEPVIDGRDISPLLFGKTKESQREAHYYFFNYELQAVRQGPWKLALAPQKEAKVPGGGALTPDVADGKLRLYNLDEEIGERTNLADKHPDIVAKLKVLAEKMDAEIGGKEPKSRRPAGETSEPQMLYASDVNPKAAAAREQSAKSLAELQVGGILSGDAAPQVGGRSFTISCDVETKQRDTIVVAHGGSGVGYALFVKDGRVVFSVRRQVGEDSKVVSVPELKASTHITASLAKDGTMTLKVGQQEPATGKAAGPLPKQPVENFCLGHDDQIAVAEYGAHKPFKGSITNLKVTTE